MYTVIVKDADTGLEVGRREYADRDQAQAYATQTDKDEDVRAYVMPPAPTCWVYPVFRNGRIDTEAQTGGYGEYVAQSEASSLAQSGQYCRVEVVKFYPESQKGRVIGAHYPGYVSNPRDVLGEYR